jgi:hypothetical protein
MTRGVLCHQMFTAINVHCKSYFENKSTQKSHGIKMLDEVRKPELKLKVGASEAVRQRGEHGNYKATPPAFYHHIFVNYHGSDSLVARCEAEPQTLVYIPLDVVM